MSSDPLDRDLFRRIQDKVAVVGIGHLPFAKDIGRPISDTAVEAIQLALDDAGLEAEDLDGIELAAGDAAAAARSTTRCWRKTQRRPRRCGAPRAQPLPAVTPAARSAQRRRSGAGG